MNTDDAPSAALRIRLAPGDAAPIYLQIVKQIRFLVAARRLPPGEELPSIRVLAEKLLINPNTVARAYRELEVEGLVEKRSTKGVYVAQFSSRIAEKERQKALHESIDALLRNAHEFDVAVEKVVDLLRERSAAHQERELSK